MTRGFLIYAFDSDISYGKLATFCAQQLKRHMPYPVALVCDKRSADALETPSLFDHVIIIETPQSTPRTLYYGQNRHDVKWYNDGRHLAYDLSPFDETILLDSDYIVQSDTLAKQFGSVEPIGLTRHAVGLDHNPMSQSDQWLSVDSICMYWATVVYFRKCLEGEAFFRLVKDARTHYAVQAELYGYDASVYRNDYVFSIAAHLWSGCIADNVPALPMPLLTALPSDEVVTIDDGLLFLVKDRASRVNYLSKVKSDIHIMNKLSLERALC